MVSAYPILSVRQVEAALQISYKSAQRYVERLVEIGLLREITGQARNRLYCADEILRAIDAPMEEEGVRGCTCLLGHEPGFDLSLLTLANLERVLGE